MMYSIQVHVVYTEMTSSKTKVLKQYIGHFVLNLNYGATFMPMQYEMLLRSLRLIVMEHVAQRLWNK